MTAPTSPHPPVAALLAGLALAPRQSHKLLNLWPLVRCSAAPAPDRHAYVPLADALDAGDLAVDEVGEGGTVPHVVVANRGAVAVLVLFGEELRGAKQNRIANASFLVPAEREVVIDVSCVEEGRWSRRDRARFGASRRVASHRLRRKMAARVAALKAAGGGGFASDQLEVWDDVRAYLESSGVRSPSRAYSDYADSRRTDVEEICAAFPAVPRQVGFVAAIGDEVVGTEVIGRADVFERVFPQLLRGYAIDASDSALAAAPPPGGPRFNQPEEFLEALATAGGSVSASLGAGEDVRLGGPTVAGCALVDGHVVHLTGFPAEVR